MEPHVLCVGSLFIMCDFVNLCVQSFGREFWLKLLTWASQRIVCYINLFFNAKNVTIKPAHLPINVHTANDSTPEVTCYIYLTLIFRCQLMVVLLTSFLLFKKVWSCLISVPFILLIIESSRYHDYQEIRVQEHVQKLGIRYVSVVL